MDLGLVQALERETSIVGACCLGPYVWVKRVNRWSSFGRSPMPGERPQTGDVIVSISALSTTSWRLVGVDRTTAEARLEDATRMALAEAQKSKKAAALAATAKATSSTKVPGGSGDTVRVRMMLWRGVTDDLNAWPMDSASVFRSAWYRARRFHELSEQKGAGGGVEAKITSGQMRELAEAQLAADRSRADAKKILIGKHL